MSFPSDNFTFAGAKYRPITPAINQRVPTARPGDPGQWEHVPYGPNKFETDGSRLHTVWSPPGGIVILSSADYATFEALYLRFGTLVTPWGTFQARLARLEVNLFTNDMTYRGAVEWQWA